MLVSTLTYVVYENFTDIGRDAWREDARTGNALRQPLADPTLFREVYRYIDEHALHGLYDVHADGSSRCLRVSPPADAEHAPEVPIPDPRRARPLPGRPVPRRLARPQGHRGRLPHRPRPPRRRRRPAAPVRVVLSSSHHEYWTGAMLDALETYLSATAADSCTSAATPVRRRDRRPGPPAPRRGAPLGCTAGRSRCRPPSATTRMTGEPGGTWRNRGRAPQPARRRRHGRRRVRSRVALPARCPTRYDPRVAFIFEGIDGDLIGDEPNLQVRWGAAGYEFDRVEFELGSPAATLRWPRRSGFNALARVDDR